MEDKKLRKGEDEERGTLEVFHAIMQPLMTNDYFRLAPSFFLFLSPGTFFFF
ncbi:MAG: hypothetical protein PVH61_12065 [Candidatus Aminicenantes bacterium]